MAEHRRKCIKCGVNRAERFFVSARGRVCLTCQRAVRRTHARKQLVGSYGISPAEYDALFEKQHGVCAICGQSRKYKLNIDHDHAVERELGTRASVRGLLCRRCNKLLAVAGDSLGVLAQAHRYLEDPPSRGIIGL